MSFFRQKHFLVAILIFAAIIRLWRLGEIPPSPDWDEAALGYNAYSILKTGRDEYGIFLPATLRSFDDYKPPLYAYIAVPSVAFFGLNTWAVRLPSALMGVLAVLGTYFLVIELFRSHISVRKHNKHLTHALLSALLLALSPWHIQFSRIAFEANMGVTFHIWAVVLLFVGLTRPKWLIPSAVLFGLGLYSYHSERIFLPMILLIFALIWRNILLKHTRQVLIGFAVGFLIILPLLREITKPATLTRLRGTSSLADQTALLARSARKLDDDKKMGNIWGLVFDNRRIVWVRTILDGYLSHFSLRWLFLTGDNPRHHAPDVGLLYLWELPFLFFGLYALAKTGGSSVKFLFSWFLIAPIAASPTTELPHAIRSIVFLPTFQIFTAAGIIAAFDLLGRYKNAAQKLALILLAMFIAGNIYYYFHMYFAHTNHEFSKYWQYGYKQAIEYVNAHKNTYKKIVVSTKLEQPYMFFLYYLRYDPAMYLAQGGTQSGGFAEYKNKFDIYEFREINWGNEKRDGETLFIGTPAEISDGILEIIHYLDGTEAIRIAR